MLGRIAREVLLAEIRAGGNLESDLEYGNYGNTAKYREDAKESGDRRGHGQDYCVPGDASTVDKGAAGITSWDSR